MLHRFASQGLLSEPSGRSPVHRHCSSIQCHPSQRRQHLLSEREKEKRVSGRSWRHLCPSLQPSQRFVLSLQRLHLEHRETRRREDDYSHDCSSGCARRGLQKEEAATKKKRRQEQRQDSRDSAGLPAVFPAADPHDLSLFSRFSTKSHLTASLLCTDSQAQRRPVCKYIRRERSCRSMFEEAATAVVPAAAAHKRKPCRSSTCNGERRRKSEELSFRQTHIHKHA